MNTGDSTCATVFRHLSCSLQLILVDCLSICRLSAEMSAIECQRKKEKMQCYELWSIPSQLSSPTLFLGPDIKKSVHKCILSVSAFKIGFLYLLSLTSNLYGLVISS